MSDQLNAGATSDTTWTWKTLHNIHAHIQCNKENMKEWLWRPNDIRGPCERKASWHLSYRRGKTPKKPYSGNLSRPGIEPGPAAWQACMLPPSPQRHNHFLKIKHKRICLILKSNYNQNNLFIAKSILKMECFTSKHNVHETFWNLNIIID